MKSAILPYIVLASALACGTAFAQSTGSGSTQQPPASNAQGTQPLPQQIKQKLQNQGFTNVQVVPGSFLVSAKDKQGDPVNMVIGPHSMFIVTENVSGTNQSGSSGNQNSSTTK